MFKSLKKYFTKKQPEIYFFETLVEAVECGTRLTNSSGYGYGKNFTLRPQSCGYMVSIERE